jgi:hypothetical protein
MPVIMMLVLVLLLLGVPRYQGSPAPARPDAASHWHLEEKEAFHYDAGFGVVCTPDYTIQYLFH